MIWFIQFIIVIIQMLILTLLLMCAHLKLKYYIKYFHLKYISYYPMECYLYLFRHILMLSFAHTPEK